MTFRYSSTAAGLATAVTLAVASAFAVGAYFYSRHHFDTMVESARLAAQGQGELMREALEHQMLEKDRTLIARMVESFGRGSDIVRVDILDHQGWIRYSSRPGETGTKVGVEAPPCQSCHRQTPAERTTSLVLEPDGYPLLRVVVPFPNREACHLCHDPDRSVNGVLILDRDVEGMRTAMNRDLRRMVAGSGVLALLLTGTVAGIVQLLLLRRLRRFETTARQIAQGDLERRVPTGGSDTISWLAKEFNSMADSVTGLVREVRNQRQRLETVINSIDDGLVVLDPQRRIIAANAAFVRRTGHVREEVLGCCCGEVAEGICTTTDCPTLACLESGEPQVRICERRGLDGIMAWEEVHSSPILGAKGEIVQVVEVWRDISERRGAEARLAESHRLASLGTLASGFSHEMSTPLATVLTCIEGILKDSRGDAGVGREAIGRIAESASIARDQILRCRGVTQHFLRLSRGQSSAGDAVRVGAVVKGVARLVAPNAQPRGVEVVVIGADSDVRVRADESELEHALMNLLINALDACGPGKTVTVELEDGEEVRIRVKDNGSGIPPEQLNRIFEPFVSLRRGGTGLGLFLALNFVRRWGGDIRVTSRPREGSTFEIILPALREAGEREPLP